MNERVAINLSYENFLTGNGKKYRYVPSHCLLIANFQRNIKWEKKHVISLIKAINENEKHFFLGNILVQTSKEGSSGENILIDGQQRLVTLSLILTALNEANINISIKQKFNSIIFESIEEGIARITFSRKKLDDIYQKIIHHEKEIKISDKSQEKIYKNFLLIKKEIEKISDLEEFSKKILLIEFVAIKCPTSHDVHQLFESLNSQGKKLSAVELTKSVLLGNIKRLDESRLNEFEAMWESIEDSFEKESIVWFDKFLRHQWFSIGGYTSNENLFEDIKSQLKDQEKFFEYSKNLKVDSKVYKLIRNGDLKKGDLSPKMNNSAWQKAESLLKLTNEFNLDQIYSVFLGLIKYGKKNPGYFERDTFFRDIEKLFCFLVLVKYSKISPASYETLFANFCFDLNGKNLNYKTTRILFFNNLKKVIENEQSSFVNNINNKIKYTGERKEKFKLEENSDFIKLLLLLYLSSGQEFLGDYIIEHIIPKGNLSLWKKIALKFKIQIEAYDRFKLGNLTLLKNDTVGNQNFNFKYKNAYSKSIFIKNKYLKNYSVDFNSSNPGKAVRKRGKNIGDELFDICINKLIN